jgi:hypothetical protein
MLLAAEGKALARSQGYMTEARLVLQQLTVGGGRYDVGPIRGRIWRSGTQGYKC